MYFSNYNIKPSLPKDSYVPIPDILGQKCLMKYWGNIKYSFICC